MQRLILLPRVSLLAVHCVCDLMGFLMSHGPS
jgi:hypothetical protein